jgi:hypothetical protein
MNRLKTLLTLTLAAALLSFPPRPARSFAQGTRRGPALTAQQQQRAWTLEEALAQMRLHPQDAYLQYVALQLARRAGRFGEVAAEVQSLVPNGRTANALRRDRVDLFSIFNGALAVQESLQLDTMRAATPEAASDPAAEAAREDFLDVPPPPAPPPGARPARRAGQSRGGRAQRRNAPAAPASRPATPPARAKTIQTGQRPDVAVSSLSGPTVKSHPWEQMLGRRKAEVSALSRRVPEDFYFVEFRSLSKLLEAFDAGDLWGTHLSGQALHEARTLDAGERLKRQLAIEPEPALSPFYDLAIGEVAAVGSDPFVREGSDVTLLFRLKQPDLFYPRMYSFLDKAERANPKAERTTGEHLGAAYLQVTTPERDLSVISGEPEPGLHVRSNSLEAFRRVVEAIKGRDASGRRVRRLGETPEFTYVRTLLPRTEADEDGFVYLSDPFIRRLVGPEMKLTERRRLLCYNRLRMIGHAALLYRTERGRWPASLPELHSADASPGLFGEGALSCPEGGLYALSEDGTTGVCTRHGHALHLTPNLEIPVKAVSAAEADEYRAFVAEYNSYWRTFFDPIAVRLKVTPRQYRAETVILPLIDNSIYTALAAGLGGQPEALDARPVPRRNIFSVNLRFNKERLLKSAAGELRAVDEEFFREMGVPRGTAAGVDGTEFLSRGIGNQLGFHVYDARPAFDLNMSSLVGLFISDGAGVSPSSLGGFEFLALMAVASVNSPVYVSVPVRDAQVVDRFLEQTDAAWAALSRRGRRGRFRLELEEDFFKFTLTTGETARGFGLRFGPAKLRFFWARIGEGLYIASKPFILEDLAAMHRAGGRPDADAARSAAPSHALARVRADNWNEVLEDYRLSWAENEREACLNNLGPLSSVSRALSARAPGGDAPPPPTGEARDRSVLELAGRLHAARFFCPEGGAYQVSPDGLSVSCTVHGGALAPRQTTAPSERSAAGRTMRTLGGVTASLTFTGEGLHAVLTIERK